MAIPLAGLVAGGGAALSTIGGILGGLSSKKEQKRMRQFLERIYNDYINSPLYAGARDFTLSLLKEGDYQNVFRNALVEGLERNKANLLAGERAMQDRSARGGFLRGGQQESLLGRARDAQFAADRGAYRDFAEQQFNAKLTGAQMADNLAKGPFQAGAQIAPQMFNPELAQQTSPWTYLGELGGQISNFGMGQLGQANTAGPGLLYGNKQMYNPANSNLNVQYTFFNPSMLR